MGACTSRPDISERDLQLHKAAEKEMKETKARLAALVKVLLLGAGDSGKSTILKQMRLIHRKPFTANEKEEFRQLVFENLTHGMRTVVEALPGMGLELPVPPRLKKDEEEEGNGSGSGSGSEGARVSGGERNRGGYTRVYGADDREGREGYVLGWAPGECGCAGTGTSADGAKIAKVFRQRQLEADVAASGGDETELQEADGVHPDAMERDLKLIENAPDLRDGEAFPLKYLGAVLRLWEEPVIREAWSRGNEAALPDNLPYLITSLSRIFAADYVPTEQDILHTRARTIGISETRFQLADQEMLMVDVGGQKSERRKWIHCFQDVTSILFLVSLSGYDECLFEDRGSNRMQDAMTIWDSICHSQWFKQTSIILFLNKDDLFQRKIRTSPIRPFFPDFDGEPGNAVAGREYFKKRFGRLAIKAGRVNGKGRDREVYIHVTNATNTELLRVVMAAVEDIVLRTSLHGAALM
ncbi:Heterotrimeric G-protein alpha subunit 4 [Mycena kentingensis (nom. inval.)]|nr:Heterotrimeric G-protein alpha subunit 4 [Mycena kentingensis (nom. inval.)]